MSQISSMYGNLPGLTTAIEEYESAVLWGPAWQYMWWNGYISANAVDSGNSPTWRLRPGLVMGNIISTGQWTNYSPTATDGSEVAAAVLVDGLRMQDVLTGSNTTKFYRLFIGGRVKSANLLGLDGQARAQMAYRFTFDDNIVGRGDFPIIRFQTKTANYQVLAIDNLSEFNTLGATGEVDFTLPAIANGYYFTFSNEAAQIMKVISTEGTNMIAFNNLSATSVAFSTGGAEIGGKFAVYSNPAGTKWIVNTLSAGANTVTVA
jgi:hypothetical protein